MRCFLTIALLAPAVAMADDKPTPAEYADKVFTKANKAKSVKIVLKAGEDPKTAEEWIYFFGRDLGIRMELRDPKTGDATRIAIGSAKAEKMIMLDVNEKTATARRFTATQFDNEANGLIPARVRTGTDIKSAPDEKVGGRTLKVLDGLAKGGTGGVWTLWVDPTTDLPVRLLLVRPGPKDKAVSMDMTFDDWDKELDAKLFSVEVPDGYKLAPVEKK